MTPELLTDLDSRQRASRSWFPPHLKTRPTLCEAVFQPTEAAQLLEFVYWARENHKRFRAVGGGTGVDEPEACEIAVDTSLLTDIRWDEEDLTVTAGAGVTLAALEEQLAGHGYTLGQSIGSANLATVGGCIATDAHGLFSGRYGSFHQAVLHHNELAGIITDATLRLWPQPEARAWAVFDFPNIEEATTALRLIYRSDSRPALARTHPCPSLAAREGWRGTSRGGFEAEGARVVLAFEGDELVQTGHFQLAYAVCQQLGGTPADPDEGEQWLEERQKNTLWHANAQEGVFGGFLRFPTPWSTLTASYGAFQQCLEGRAASFSLEVAHPTPHGAAIELAFTVHGDERRYRELSQLIVAGV